MRPLACYGIACLLTLLSVPLGCGQSTQGIVLGRITDAVTGLPLAATITSLREDTGWRSTTKADAGGNYGALRALEEITDSVARGRSLTVAALNAHRGRAR